MKTLTEFFHHSISRAFLVIGALLVLVLGVAFTRDTFAANSENPVSQRLVTIHVGDNEVTVLTRATTIGEALKQANITLNPQDVVEPAATEVLVAKTYQVNVFRARPVIVVDGARKIRVMTAEQSPRQVAKTAGVTLYDEDITTFHRVDSVLDNGGAGVEMVITRATSFYFTLYGKRFEARSQAKTVGALLKEKGVSLDKEDGVTPGLQTALAAGMEVKVWRNGKQTITQEEVVARPVEEVQDADKSVGTKSVQTEGADGTRNVTYEIEMKDGVEVSRKEIASVTTLEAVKQVVVVGTKVELPAGSHADWMAAAGIAASDYGYVDFIVGHESGWSPTKYNYGGSGAYGLCQALPAGKMASAGGDYMTNPITQLRWCNGYAVGRYGSWAGAYRFWVYNKWW